MDKTFRPIATATVKSGGLLISPFEMEHGPFGHDDLERVLIQSALARVCVFVEPGAESQDARALNWATDNHRSVFVIGETDGVGDAHQIAGDADFDWLELAISIRDEKL